MTNNLTILCVTNVGPRSITYLQEMLAHANILDAECVFAFDGVAAQNRWTREFHHRKAKHVLVNNPGPSLEPVLDEAIAACNDGYILRLDDDEVISLPMLDWLCNCSYEPEDHWCFPRLHLFKENGFVCYSKQEPLWPDYQTRLSVKEKSGGRSQLHAGSPHGMGQIAPVYIEHWKFVVKTFEERQAIAKRYDDYHPGFGTGMMLPYNLPEAYFDHQLELHQYNGELP